MKVYERVIEGLEVTHGGPNIFEIPFFSEGFIRRLLVKQYDGGTGFADFHLYIINSDKAFDHDPSHPDNGLAWDDDKFPDMYTLIKQSDINGQAGFEYYSDSHPLLFSNQDGSVSDRKRKLYLVIAPTQDPSEASPPGAYYFNVTIGGWSDVR